MTISHESEVLEPSLIEAGLAKNALMVGFGAGGGGGGSGVTETVVVADTLPCGLVAISTYEVVAVGETVSELPVTGPIP